MAENSKLANISVALRDDTIHRLGGYGDNFYMTWSQDDRQLVALCDGTGWDQNADQFYNSKLYSIDRPDIAGISEISGYPLLTPGSRDDRYYGFGTLARNNNIYQFLSTFNHPVRHPDGKPWQDLRFAGAKLIVSRDSGVTWRNQDGSEPLIWEAGAQRSRESMVFFQEDQETFSLMSILQMGRNYEHNRDGFAYVYAPNGNTEGTMNELVMFRVPVARLEQRASYEYFAGLDAVGAAKWSKSIDERRPVHVFPSGWVNTLVHPYAWQPSVVYNPGLGLYLMANWATGPAADGMWFEKPSYLGFWVS
ncbi:MAG: hypothetical protein IBJ12_16095, partial [Sphingomonadaceae bacterium]|nr:hypothetical protein [Sphingomonadaceae bacterium]